LQDSHDEASLTAHGFAAQLMEDLPPVDVRHVLDVFAADLERLYDAIYRQASASDIEGFRRNAHALAGAAGAVGAAALEAACRDAMRPGLSGPQDLAAALDAIGHAASATEADLQAAVKLLDRGHD